MSRSGARVSRCHLSLAFRAQGTSKQTSKQAHSDWYLELSSLGQKATFGQIQLRQDAKAPNLEFSSDHKMIDGDRATAAHEEIKSGYGP